MGKDGACQDRSDMKQKFKSILEKAKHFWHSIKSIHRKVWTSTGRKHLLDALKGLLKAALQALQSVWWSIMACPSLIMVANTVIMIATMLLVNIVMMAIGLVLIPLLIKLVGGLYGLAMSGDYIFGEVMKVIKQMRSFAQGHCGIDCKKNMIASVSAIVGAIVEVLLLGGIEDFLKKKTSS